MFVVLLGLVVDRCAVPDALTLGPIAGFFVTSERRREDVEVVAAVVPFDDVDDLFRCVSFGAGTAWAERVPSGRCCCWMTGANGRPLVSQGSDMNESEGELMYIVQPKTMGPREDCSPEWNAG